MDSTKENKITKEKQPKESCQKQLRMNLKGN